MLELRPLTQKQATHEPPDSDPDRGERDQCGERRGKVLVMLGEAAYDRLPGLAEELVRRQVAVPRATNWPRAIRSHTHGATSKVGMLD